ncbi:MAG: hypothetical protein Kow00121_63200 [Elainellaceae cyanobacterium]
MKILFIEDDKHTSELLSATLSAHRYAVDVVADGATGLDMASQWSYDLILLDILIPKINGIEVCRRLRAQNCQTPILILTTKAANEDVIAGLDAGADDYVAKSCDSSQLLARVRALLRRGQTTLPSPVLTWGALSLDPASAQVTYNQKEITLRPKEYSLLELFLRHPQRLFSRGAIIDHLWTIEETPLEGSVTNLIKDLRQRLKAVGIGDDLIETVYGLGYRLKTVPTEPKAAIENKKNKAKSEDKSAASNAGLVVDEKDWYDREQRVRMVVQQATERFQISLEQRISVLKVAEQSLQAGIFSEQQRNAARTQVHKLAGGLGVFGYAKASEIAEAIEHLLKTELSQQPEFTERFSQLLEALQQELAKPQTKEGTAEPSIARR